MGEGPHIIVRTSPITYPPFTLLCGLDPLHRNFIPTSLPTYFDIKGTSVEIIFFSTLYFIVRAKVSRVPGSPWSEWPTPQSWLKGRLSRTTTQIVFLRSIAYRTTSPYRRLSTKMIPLTVEFVVGMVGSQRPRFPIKCSTLRSLVHGGIVCTTPERIFFDIFFSSYDSPSRGF